MGALSEDAQGVRHEHGPGADDGRESGLGRAAGAARNFAGYIGKGIGIAIIDSGIRAKHPGPQEPRALRRWTSRARARRDLYGHGTHVASIIAGSGAGDPTSRGTSTVGMAPGAALISLKVLSADGTGYVSDVIRAIDWTIANKDRFGIRVINMSLGTPAFGSYTRRSDGEGG